MSTLPNPFQPAIDELEKDLIEAERHVNTLVSAINVLRAKSGLPPRSPNSVSGGDIRPGVSAPTESGPIVSHIKHDTFFGKRMGTAAREFLEMRKSQGQGPAKTREIFDALKAGGFQFNTRDDSIAVVSLRNTITKNSVMFQKLPNGTFGLRAWYPNAKQDKPQKIGKALGEKTQEPINDIETAAPSEDDAAA
jgi:hypothetical protein